MLALILFAASALSKADTAFLEDLEHRSFQFFWEQGDPNTGIVRDRARLDGDSAHSRNREIGSIASTGFGLTGICIAAERGWIKNSEARQRIQNTLRFFALHAANEHGWFYHWMNPATGAREWKSEISSIDTALLLGGVLTAREKFHSDREITRLADLIYRRVDFRWMLNGDPMLLSHGWKPESGFIRYRWNAYSELMLLYVLAIASPTHAIPVDAWYAWRRDLYTYEGVTYVNSSAPLFVHQYSHAWLDFRNRREREGQQMDWYGNSVSATRAHRQFCMTLASRFKGYSADVWGITASDSAHGYKVWGGPPQHGQIDGTVVPCAAGGSLMFTPQISLPALRTMYDRWGKRIYGRYGFTDAFHPLTGWVDTEVIGIDTGITLLSAENLRSGNVWKWFGRTRDIRQAMDEIFERN